MLKLISGKKGTGKTKQVIDMVNESAKSSNGKVVCIEKSDNLRFDVSHDARLINTEDYGVAGYDSFYGFIAGIVASDYDVKEIYVDSITKIVGDDNAQIGEMLAKIDKLGDENNVGVTMMVSGDRKEFPESITKYISLNLV